MSWRMPPGFMNATTAPPSAAGCVAVSCPSAITSPSVSSPNGELARVRSPWIRPMTRFDSGADWLTYCVTTACSAAAGGDGAAVRAAGDRRAAAAREIACAAVQHCAAGLEAALMDHEHRHLDALVGELGDGPVGCVRLVHERQAGHTRRRDDRRRG